MSVKNRKQMELLVRVLHHLAESFKEHAILKGGIELALFSSTRPTNDLDFVFVPYSSKKDVVNQIRTCLLAFDPAVQVRHQISSKNAKFYLELEQIAIEVEVSVALSLESISMNTSVLALPLKIPAQIIRVMKPEIALAHKIAAWNERRLLRDLYDIYFWFSVQRIWPDRDVLEQRLSRIESRRAEHKSRKKMSVAELCEELITEVDSITQREIDMDLGSLPEGERLHLDVNLRSQIKRIVHLVLLK